jgi:uncharacterized protein (DUF433 family)
VLRSVRAGARSRLKPCPTVHAAEVDTPRGDPYHSNMDSVSETYRYIARSEGVRSGNPIVENTRIAVHDVIGLLQNGETIDTLRANCFPQLTRAQIYECLAYYEDHRGEIDLLVARQMAPASE